jgi:aryl-alcohol dehydrogenase-like predicted oxidoreductase
MEYANALGRRVSILTLGAVQFGMNYGIANKTGRPTRKEVFEILDIARDAGVNVLDTAYAYGESEKVLGEWLSGRADRDAILVATKLPEIEGFADMSEGEAKSKIAEVLSTSLRRLRLERVFLYLLHRAEHMTCRDGLVMRHLDSLRREGLVEHVGVSVYTPEEALLALSVEGVSAVQVPCSVFDQRLRRSGFLERAQRQGVAVFARSVFLQGLILMPVGDVPAHLDEIAPYKRGFERLCREAGRSVAEVAFLFSRAEEGVTSVLVGVDNVAQMRANVELAARPPLSPDLLEKVRESFCSIPERLVNPARWRELEDRRKP